MQILDHQPLHLVVIARNLDRKRTHLERHRCLVTLPPPPHNRNEDREDAAEQDNSATVDTAPKNY